jgi:glycosyltransferase involved in cell wall biosynthesis
MRFLLLNQTFHPDVTATGQYLSDLARELARRGHEITVITSRRAYDDPGRCFPAAETWQGVRIRRVWNTAFGKGAKWKRAANFASFILACMLRLLVAPRAEVVVALTSPPLISFIGALHARLRGARFVYWIMDLNPDEAIAAGWLREGSIAARVLDAMSRHSLRHAEKIVVLDRFMRDRVLAKGIAPERVAILAPWSLDDAVRFDPSGRDEFRAAHGLAGRFVVMYSGNHSPCHPLDTLLAAARELAEDERFAFLFVGGGSEFRRVQEFAAAHALRNITCLPYQPLEKLSASLSAADLHVVVMGEPFVGTIHPCKVYNVLAINAPLLCIGPAQCHVADLLAELHSPAVTAHVPHGATSDLLAALRRMAASPARLDPATTRPALGRFSRQTLLPRFIALLEAAGQSGRK